MKKYDIDPLSNLYYHSMVSFYSKQRKRVLTINESINDPLLYGKDVNRFYTMLKTDSLPTVYKLLLEEAANGFFEIETVEENAEKLNKILKFLNLLVPVRIVRG
ncbi:MAG: hypothetical protein WHT65_06685 [Pseudothermotoga sp.]